LEIQQSFEVPFAQDQVWRCFHDTEAIVRCLPGAALTAAPVGNTLALSMTVKLGPIVANFAGHAEMTLDEAAHRGSIAGGGNDRKSGSRVKGEAAYSLHAGRAPGASTRIDVRVEYSIAGSLAQFSRGGIVRELAERMTAQFSSNLQQQLAAQQPEPATTPTTTPVSMPTIQAGAPPATPAAPAAPIDLGKMFWSVLIARLKRWFALSPRRLHDEPPRDR
jgi:carbon monoxide dehydrogenase subunit G